MKSQRENPIGLFDSGVGGISVANAIQALLPNENLIYVADSAHAPYGTKSADYILQRARTIVEFLLGKGAKLIVVACNTATLSCIEQLRRDYTIPFVGVEPGIKPAVRDTLSGKVGVLATQLTINTSQYQQLINRVSDGKIVISQACTGLAEQIEKAQFDSPVTLEMLQQFLQPLLDQHVDQIALGCTHYGFVGEQIEKLLCGRAKLVDTCYAVAKQTEAMLRSRELLNNSGLPHKAMIYSSAFENEPKSTIKMLWAGCISGIESFPS